MASVPKEADKCRGSPRRHGRSHQLRALSHTATSHHARTKDVSGPPVLCSGPRALQGCWGQGGPACSMAPRALPCHSCHCWKPLRDTWWPLPSPELAACAALCVQGLLEGSEQPCPGPTPPGFKTHQFPLPFPLNQPAESFINLRKRKSKQKEPKAEPKHDLNNLPSLSSLGPRHYLSAFAESPPSGDAPGPSGAGPRHSPRSSNDSVISAVSSSASLRRRRGDALPGWQSQGSSAPAHACADPSRDGFVLLECGLWGCGTGLSLCPAGQK